MSAMLRVRGPDGSPHGLLTRMRLAIALLGMAAILGSAPSAAADAAPADQQPATAESWAMHGQFTYVEQETLGFNAPYRGPNSLTPNQGRETVDATLFLGKALWPGAEGWIVPEIDQGFGLDDTLGVAGFPSAEAYKVGRNRPYLRLTRIFVRDTVNLGGDSESVEPGAMQLGGQRSANRWVFTLGKISVVDLFDNNAYAHDSKGDFLNWTMVDAGSFDYAADAWAYTVGAAAERYQGAWTLRAGIFDMSDIPNSPQLDPGFHEFQMIAEIEKRHVIADHPGKVMITAFESRARMALLDQAVQYALATGGPVLVAPLRQYRGRLGVDADLEQEISADLGLFARVGKAAGNVEAYEFTDVDRSVSAGVSLKGTSWGRTRDSAAIGFVDNGISAERERFLNAGGLGILIGDGKLPHPGAEEIVETYYDAALFAHAQLTLDYQCINHPAYNRDRGPVSVWAVRFHAQF